MVVAGALLAAASRSLVVTGEGNPLARASSSFSSTARSTTPRRSRAGEALRFLRDHLQVHVLRRLAAQVDVEDRGPGGAIWGWHKDDAVKSPGPAERRVQVQRQPWSLPAPARRHFLLLHAVQFRQELVDELPPRARPHIASRGPGAIDLIKEQHARRMLAPAAATAQVQLLLGSCPIHMESTSWMPTPRKST